MLENIRFVRLIAQAFAGLAIVMLGCSSIPVPIVEATSGRDLSVPVVLVPGITGTRLRSRQSGEIVWGTGSRLLSPRDGGYAFARSLDPDAEIRLEPAGVLEVLSLSGLRKDVYGPIIRMLEQNGYQRGDLEVPQPQQSAFLFGYDWRQDNIASVERLYDQLEGLRLARGEERLRVALICQSNGGYICRYLARYGNASLEDAEAGHARPPATLEITRIILVGTANGGSIRILRELHRGRRYIPAVGRKIEPETLFTFPSLYQDLPVYREDWFVDHRGEALDGDLFDAETWRRYGLSVFAERTRKRIEESDRRDLFGTEADRLAFLTAQLDRAHRFQRLLRQGADPLATRFYLIQNGSDETPERAVLVPSEEAWKVLFSGDKELERRPAAARAATTVGDGHATRASQLWLSPRETAAIAAPPFYVEGDHFELILNPKTLEQLMRFLDDPVFSTIQAPAMESEARLLPVGLGSRAVGHAVGPLKGTAGHRETTDRRFGEHNTPRSAIYRIYSARLG